MDASGFVGPFVPTGAASAGVKPPANTFQATLFKKQNTKWQVQGRLGPRERFAAGAWGLQIPLLVFSLIK